MFQSTRLREARRDLLRKMARPYAVSIHAPAGGATAQNQLAETTIKVSIHAPAGGATI